MNASHEQPAPVSTMHIVPGIPLRQSRDSRGVVFEPLEADALAAQRNVHVVLSAPGAVRGNHFHRVQHEITVVVGPARVAWRAADRDAARQVGDAATASPVEAVEVPAGAAWRFEFPPGVAHAFENTGRETQVLIAFATHPHDPANPDTFPALLLGTRDRDDSR